LRYIDSTEIQEELPEGWEDKAKEAYETVLALSPEERSGAIDRFSYLWKQLKDILYSHFHGKCWYCEAIQERSDNAVDHFRPKNKVFECPKHGGYWWLAFKWLNYRYSCTFCNSRRINKDGVSGGKHDHFPLEEEQKRAYTPEDDLDAEQPLLLDPTSPADPGLLWFDEDGQAVPNPQFCTDHDSYFFRRADASITLYQLNHVNIVERRKRLCKEIRDLVGELNYYFTKYQQGNQTARSAYADRIKLLRRKVMQDMEYSATAYAMLMGLRGSNPAIELVVQAR
jgi:uncharacterized protein (TIGR02646 family)